MIQTSKRLKYFHSRSCEQIERLQVVSGLFPIPAFITFTIVMVLMVYLFPRVNPRIGQIAQIIELNTFPEPEGSIWFSVKVIDYEVVVVTYDKEVFRWPRTTTDLAPLQKFRDYLAKTTRRKIELAALAREGNLNTVSAVIAADESMRYVHLKPIINALAEAKISHYGFETRMTAEQPAIGHH